MVGFMTGSCVAPALGSRDARHIQDGQLCFGSMTKQWFDLFTLSPSILFYCCENTYMCMQHGVLLQSKQGEAKPQGGVLTQATEMMHQVVVSSSRNQSHHNIPDFARLCSNALD